MSTTGLAAAVALSMAEEAFPQGAEEGFPMGVQEGFPMGVQVINLLVFLKSPAVSMNRYFRPLGNQKVAT